MEHLFEISLFYDQHIRLGDSLLLFLGFRTYHSGKIGTLGTTSLVYLSVLAIWNNNMKFGTVVFNRDFIGLLKKPSKFEFNPNPTNHRDLPSSQIEFKERKPCQTF